MNPSKWILAVLAATTLVMPSGAFAADKKKATNAAAAAEMAGKPQAGVSQAASVEAANASAAERLKADRAAEAAKAAAAAEAAKATPPSGAEKAMNEKEQKALDKAQEKSAEDQASSEKKWWARYGKEKPLLGPFQFGPKLNLGVLTPSLGLEMKLFNLVSLSAEGLYIPGIAISGISIGATAWSVGMRIHPFVGSFFLGTNIGQLNLIGSTSQTFEITTPVALQDTRQLSATAQLTYVTPMLGWRWVTKSGFFTGLEMGVQITINSSITPEVERKEGDDASFVEGGATLNGAIDDALASVQGDLNQIADIPKQYPLPHLMFNIGFMF